MWIRALLLLLPLALCFSCARVEAPDQNAAETDLEAEGEARAEAVADRLVGQPGPAITLATIDGATIDLASLYGKKPVYLKFWATWCAPCRKQMPEFETIYETLGDRLEVIAVNTGYSDDADAVRKYLGEIDLKMPIAVDDGRLADLLDLRVTPQHVVIGLDARISYVGHLDGEPLERALQEALAGSPSKEGPVQPTPPKMETVLRPGGLLGNLLVTTLGGETIPLGEADGKRRGVLFFSPWCESYLAETRPKVSEACRRAREDVEQRAAREDRQWIAVSGRLWASEGDLEQYRKDTGSQVPLALDSEGQIFRAFGVRQIPAIALIDGDGRLERMVGAEDRID